LRAKAVHQEDLATGARGLAAGRDPQKYSSAPKDPRWEWVFPAPNLWRDREGKEERHHLQVTVVQRVVTRAARKAQVDKRVTSHTFRHLFATPFLERAHDIQTVQKLLGHRDGSTTMIYTHVLRNGARGVKSPLDG
jgi:integrase